METEIRGLVPADWESVRSIYLAGIATGQATFETESPTWEDWNDAHLPAPRLVATANEVIVGWAALSPASRRPVYAGVAEVSVYVDAQRRGQGVGALLLETLVKQSEANGIWTLLASISLHQSAGFREVGGPHRIGKMKGVWRDTVLFERRSEVVENR